MITIRPHACLVDLQKAFVSDLFSGQPDPIPQRVIAPSKQLTDWLQAAVAREKGICMGMELILPRNFVNRITGIFPDATHADALNPWSKEALTWRILPMAPSLAGHFGMTSVESGSRDAFALARTVADRLDQYSHFRSDWIQQWHRHPDTNVTSSNHESWQRELWVKLQRSTGEEVTHPAIHFHPAAQDREVRLALKAAFPVLRVVGIGSLDPLLVEILKLMDQAGCQITVHLVLPSLHFLGDLRRKAALGEMRWGSEQSAEDFQLPDTHPLLVSMGKHAVGSFLLMGDLDDQYNNWPADGGSAEGTTANTLLGHLQQDVRGLLLPRGQAALPDTDNSIRIHACHSPRREMEVLRDELLRAFAEIPNLQPEDIVIVTPSLETYAPLVDSVLAQRRSSHDGTKTGLAPALPVRLTELPPAEQDPILEGWIALLELGQGRRTASELLPALQLRAVRACLGTEEDNGQVEMLQNWIRASGLTEGLEVWRRARSRLIAGHWFGAEDRAKDATGRYLLPVAEDLGGDAALKMQFLCWLATLSETLETWETAAAPRAWAQRLRETAKLLLSPEDAAADALGDIPPQLFLEQVDCATEVEAGAILDWLRSEAEELRRKGSITGGMAFGRFKQLHTIPCRVLAMVGMQETAFPAQNKTVAWDLMQAKPKIWDRNPRVDDRQLFLDALLTPTDRLIITGSTQNVLTGKTEPFSTCVDELLRVLQQMVPPETSVADRLVLHHRILPFASDYFNGRTTLPHSFDQRSADIATELAKETVRQGMPLGTKPSAAPDTPTCDIGLQQLVDFWKNPAKAFLDANSITIPRDADDDEALDRPPLSLNPLQTWAIQEKILSEIVERKNENLDHTRALAEADRGLPSKKLGGQAWKNIEPKIQRLAEQITKVRGTAEPLSVAHSIADGSRACHIHGDVLRGTVGDSSVLLFYRTGTMEKKTRHWLQPWIHAVAASASGHALDTCVLAEDYPGTHILPAIPQTEAQHLLENLVQGYLAGQDRPLCYAPETSKTYSAKLTTGEAQALAAASDKWFARSYDNLPDGEGQEPAAQLAWRDQDPFDASRAQEWKRWANDVTQPLSAWSENAVPTPDSGNAPPAATRKPSRKKTN